MKTSAMTLGICKNARCNVQGREPVERYEGPGMYCPDCGELLQAYDPHESDSKWALPTAESPKSSSANGRPGVEPQVQAPPPNVKAQRRSSVRRFAVAATSVAVVLLVAAAVVAGTIDHSLLGNSSVVGVCRSSVSDHLVSDLLHSYTPDQSHANHFEIRSANCDVRFAAIDTEQVRGAQNGTTSHTGDIAGPVIAYDAVVAIVNPQNPIPAISVDQLRGVFSGALNEWTSVHGMPGPMTVYLPKDGTDESGLVEAAILKGTAIGTTVVRLPSSADVVRAVTAANGRGAIGMVAFSQAVPGKVLTIKDYATPSILSIGEQRYPFILSIAVQAMQTNNASVPSFVHYATSEDAKMVAVRDGFVR